jgi:hypothetical protein
VANVGRTRTWTVVAFGAMGGSSILLGLIEFGIAVTHVRGRAAGSELFAAATGLVLVAFGIGFARQALRVGIRRPRLE